MKRITFLMLHLNYGGIEKQTTLMINELCKLDYNVEILCVYDILGQPFYDIDKRVNITYLTKGFPNKIKMLNDFKNLNIIDFFKELCISIKCLFAKYVILKRRIKKLDTDIIFSTRPEFCKMIKRVDTYNISQEHSFINDINYFSYAKNCFKNIDKVVVMTDKAKEIYLKNNVHDDIQVIPNMINDNKDEKYSLLKNRQIIAIGRLEEVKNFKSLINIFREISLKNDKYILKIIGEGKLRYKLQDIIDKYKLTARVVLTGTLNEDELKREILKSDALCVTSKSESFSLVICEAMSLGVPVIAYDVDVGPREIIENEVDGYLVEKDNSKEYISKLDKLLKDYAIRTLFSKRAIIKSKRYYSSNVIKKWDEILNKNGGV